MQRPTILSFVDTTHERDPLEDHPLFTPDVEYCTPPTNVSFDNKNAYQPHTLTPYNTERQTVLPAFPPSPFLTHTNDEQQQQHQPTLLLANVPIEKLSQLQVACRTPNAYLSPFELIEQGLEMIDPTKDSFIGSVYQQLLSDLSSKWKISIPILDYNLARLTQCAKKCLAQLQQQHRQGNLQLQPAPLSTATFSMEELSLALEFYLQIDVDLFYLKTCSFRQAKPIEETIFGSKSPENHYHMTACNKVTCSCCHPSFYRISTTERTPIAVHFSYQGKYRFINGYQTILNCPATCETTNMIYVLACPCGQFEYLGATTMSFRDCLTMHRQESYRIVREFILGPTTTSRILQGNKSEEARRNDHLWLYQHTARCSTAIQLFLDTNPDYWCFVPVRADQARSRSNTRARSLSPQTTSTPSSVRPKLDARYLAEQIPDPPDGYLFTDRQRYQQIEFFRTMKDQQLLPSSLDTPIDLCDAAMIAVLPENCSELFRQLILSLFITHADCDLNQKGRLTNETIHREYPFRGFWCTDLVRRPLSSF